MDTAAEDGGASAFVLAPALAEVKEEQPPDFEDAPDPVAPPRVRKAAVAAAATIAAATADDDYDDSGEESASDELAVDAAGSSDNAAGDELPARSAYQQLLPGGNVAAGEDAVMIARNRGAPLTLNPTVGTGEAGDSRKYDR